jgi:plasmid stabilization system protein ParE
MKSYKIKVTDYALHQMQEIVDYISIELLSPDTARRWLKRLNKALSSLSQMPDITLPVDEESFHSEGVRKLLHENYYAYYYINEDTDTVWIIAVVYTGMDQTEQLKQIPPHK